MLHRALSRRAIAAWLALAAGNAFAAPLPPAARAEIDALLKALQTSGCQFNRNGSWYSAAEAQAHLARKLEYLEGKELVKSAEDFIDRGASGSSSSGKPYLVRCGDAPAVESKVWLKARLVELRLAR